MCERANQSTIQTMMFQMIHPNNVYRIAVLFSVLLILLPPHLSSVLAFAPSTPLQAPSSFTHHTNSLTHNTRTTHTTRSPSSSFSSSRNRHPKLHMMDEIQCDVVIIGGGPAGCTCAMYTSRAQHKTVILDKNPAAGALAITHTIANYPGVDPTISGEALLESMREQAVQYGTEYHRAQVFMVDFEDKDSTVHNKVVYTPEATYRARALVLATGAMGRKPSFKGEDTYLGSGVSYCATCDGAFYQDSEVCVVGTNLEAMEEASFLTKFASTLHWITRNDVDFDDDHVRDLLAHDNVKHWPTTKLMSIDGDGGGVTGVTVCGLTKDDVSQTIPVEGAFIYEAGSKPITDFIGETLEYKPDGGVVVNDEMCTSVEGVYGIGDIRNTPYKQVVVAASDGCVAAMSIDRYLKGRKTVRVDWIHS